MKRIIVLTMFLLVTNICLAALPENITAGDTYTIRFEITNNPVLFIFSIDKPNTTPQDFAFSASFNNKILNCTQNALEWVCINDDEGNGVFEVNLTLNIAEEPGSLNYNFLALKEEELQQFFGSGGTIYQQENEEETQCLENWKCTEWLECEEGLQKRECIDLNKCGTEDKRPEDTKPCSFEQTIEQISPSGPTGLFLVSATDWLIGIISGLIIAIIVIFFLKRRKKTLKFKAL